MANNVKITSTEVLSENYFPLKKFKYEIGKKNGEVTEITREVYMSSNGAAVLLYNTTENTVVLTRQFRLPTFVNNNETGMLIEVCAGIVEKGEAPAKAILREIEEETGYKVKEAKKVFEAYSTPGSVSEMLTFFVAEYTQTQKISEGGGLEHENEDIEVIEMSFEAAYVKIQSGEIRDAKTIMLLQYAKIYLFQEEKVFEVL